MALLKPCGRLVQAFGKLPVFSQFEYTRGIERVARTRVYVTVAPKLGNSETNSEKLEASSNNFNANDITWPIFASNLRRKLALLCLMKNDTVRSWEISRMIKSCASRAGMTEDSIGLIVLHYCGDMLFNSNAANRRILTSHVWEYLSQDASALTLKHYNTLLSIHNQNNQPVEPEKFLDDMIVKPDSTTYKLLLNTVAKCGNIESSLYVLQRMKNEDQLLNEEVFNSLILAYGTNKDIKAVLSTLYTMINIRIQPSLRTYTNIACAYVSVADIHNTMKLLNAYSFNVVQIMEIIKRLSICNLGKHIPDVLRYLPLRVDASHVIVLNTIMELTHDGRPEDAFKVLNYLTCEVSTDKTDIIFKIFLKHLVKAKIPSGTILKFMNEIMTVKNYSLVILDVCKNALVFGERELTMAIFEVMHEREIELRPHYYWSLLIQASRSHDETDIFRTLKHMLCLNVVLDYNTLFEYVLPYINTIDPFSTLQKLNDLGLEISVVFTPLICYLLKTGKITEALSLCSTIKRPIDFDKVVGCLALAYKSSKNVNDCVKMFKFALSVENYPEEFLFILFGKIAIGQDALLLNEFLQAFKALEIPVSNFTTVEVKAQEIDKADGSNKVTLINPLDSMSPSIRMSHPRRKNLEELECRLIKFKAKGMNIRHILQTLLISHCKENNLKRVEEIIIEHDQNGFLWTHSMYISLLLLYVRNGRGEEAMSLYSQLQHCKNLQIGGVKMISLAKALVNANMINEAFTVLESTTWIGSSLIMKNCRRLLNAVARSPKYELTETMLDVLVNSKFCAPNNIILGPLVRGHLLRDNLASAVDTFAECAKRYRQTPLRHKLVCALVKSMNTNKSEKDELMKLFAEVQSITTQIHGSDNARLDLFMALAELGMTDKLRKFLQSEKISNSLLIQKLKHVMGVKKLLTLTTFLDASIEIPYINRSFIYKEILSEYSRSGDCEKAIELWKKILAEEGYVSRAFITDFVSLLTKHKAPLPEIVSDVRLDE